MMRNVAFVAFVLATIASLAKSSDSPLVESASEGSPEAHGPSQESGLELGEIRPSNVPDTLQPLADAVAFIVTQVTMFLQERVTDTTDPVMEVMNAVHQICNGLARALVPNKELTQAFLFGLAPVLGVGAAAAAAGVGTAAAIAVPIAVGVSVGSYLKKAQEGDAGFGKTKGKPGYEKGKRRRLEKLTMNDGVPHPFLRPPTKVSRTGLTVTFTIL